MSKPQAGFPRPLSDLLRKTLNEGFARQGFASSELVTRWETIAGADIAAHCEPIKIQWPRPVGDEEPDPATLVLRVEGPMAIEIQHQSAIILEKVNRFFGWHAIGQIALRQAPLRRRPVKPTPPAGPDPQKTARVAANLGDIADDDLKSALARLGASVKRT
jgi:hypothetical protein